MEYHPHFLVEMTLAACGHCAWLCVATALWKNLPRTHILSMDMACVNGQAVKLSLETFRHFLSKLPTLSKACKL